MVDIVYKPLIPVPQSSITLNTITSQKEFFSTLAIYGTKIFKRKAAVGEVNLKPILYTVPQGKVFYLLSAWINIRNVIAYDIAYFFNNDDTNTTFLAITNTIQAGAGSDAQSQVLCPSIPIRYTAGEFIQTNSENVNTRYIAGIIGYEIDSAILPNFN